jgi:hypothetical protein
MSETSETAKRLFDSLKAAKDAVLSAAPGLKDFAADVKAEASRMGVQGAMELASALFGTSAFVPYGPGQYTPQASQEHPSQEPQAEQTREGMGR